MSKVNAALGVKYGDSKAKVNEDKEKQKSTEDDADKEDDGADDEDDEVIKAYTEDVHYLEDICKLLDGEVRLIALKAAVDRKKGTIKSS